MTVAMAARPTPRRVAVLTSVGLAAIAVAVAVGSPSAAVPGVLGQDRTCPSGDPLLATSRFARGRTFDNEPAVIAFHDTPDDSDQLELASIGDVGAVYGLAYDPVRDVLYAAAYHKRNSKHGPEGPGGIYEVAPDGSSVEPFLEVPDAGNDLHERGDNYQPDSRGRRYVGKTSLGDVEISADGTTLFVMNLADRRIYRFALPSGTLVGSFDHGARPEKWYKEARPFGLAVHDGWLFHGLVRSGETTRNVHNLDAFVYASRPDGTEMKLVAQLDLDYDRGRHPDWKTWPRDDDIGPLEPEYPHPMLTDIAFSPDGDMIVGLRDRFIDTGPSLVEVFRATYGDVLRLEKTGDMMWGRDPDADEFYVGDDLPPRYEELAMGGLARLPGIDVVVSTAVDPLRTFSDLGNISAGAIWLDTTTGDDVAREELMYNLRRHAGPQGKANGLGDVEVLCVVPTTPTPTVTLTPWSSPTVTETPTTGTTPSATPTATVTLTPTLRPQPIYLPLTDKGEKCIPDAFHSDVVLVLDRSTSMLRSVEEGGMPKNEAAIEAAKDFVNLLDFTPDELNRHDQVAIVGFNDTAWTEIDLGFDREAALNALDVIRTKTIEGTRLDLAILQGQKPLDGPNRKPENRAVMILLTDGLPNRVPTPVPSGPQEETVGRAADAAKDKGTRIYTIGLGKPTDINPRLLIYCSTERWMYYYAPRPEQLKGIYSQIAQTFDTCEPQVWRVPTPCVPEDALTDVVLVLDMSTSMYRTTRSGRTKHEAAVEAARTFIDQMDFEPDGWGQHDQVAIVGFNDEAWTEVELTRDKDAVYRGLDMLMHRIDEGTRLDLAFKEARKAAAHPNRLPENTPVIILLTDGLPNRVPTPVPSGPQEETVLKYAQAAKEAGSRVFTIGLGEEDDVFKSLLELCATEPSMFYFAPDGEDLSDIYKSIAGRIVECP